MNEDTQVQGNQTGDELAKADVETKGSGVASTQATTTTPKSDADVQALQEKMDALAQTYEKDLRGLKSSLQRRESELTRQWQEQEQAYQNKIRQLELAGLDDDARAEYEANFAVERVQELENQLRQANSEIEQREAFNAALSYFTQAGISPSSLDAENGYEALIQSGWEALRTERDELREKLKSTKTETKSTKDNQPNPPKPAPSVDTGGGTPATGITWADVMSSGKYETEEDVYRAFEQGLIPASAIPGNKEVESE